MTEFLLGRPLDESQDGFVKMPPPVVLAVQPNSYVPMTTPEQLRAWEEAVRMTTGIEIVADNLAGRASESGSEGNNKCISDDCALV